MSRLLWRACMRVLYRRERWVKGTLSLQSGNTRSDIYIAENTRCNLDHVLEGRVGVACSKQWRGVRHARGSRKSELIISNFHKFQDILFYHCPERFYILSDICIQTVLGRHSSSKKTHLLRRHMQVTETFLLKLWRFLWGCANVPIKWFL